jgi:hypothetical protein
MALSLLRLLIGVVITITSEIAEHVALEVLPSPPTFLVLLSTSVVGGPEILIALEGFSWPSSCLTVEGTAAVAAVVILSLRLPLLLSVLLPSQLLPLPLPLPLP